MKRKPAGASRLDRPSGGLFSWSFVGLASVHFFAGGGIGAPTIFLIAGFVTAAAMIISLYYLHRQTVASFAKLLRGLRGLAGRQGRRRSNGLPVHA